eukprot:23685-Eustigmatos_ZCMA.PRE.1
MLSAVLLGSPEVTVVHAGTFECVVVVSAMTKSTRNVLAITEEHRAGGERAEALLSNPVAMEAICCSQEAPEPCFWPTYVKHRMGEYYPST